MHFTFCGKTISLEKKALVLGILNVTPDSFTDAGAFFDAEKAITHGLKLIEEGADILDIGGESTRPGKDSRYLNDKTASPATFVHAEEELRRVIPVIKGLRKETTVPISIDTYKAAVAEAALAAGADIVNDITALQGDENMGPVVAKTGAGLILMHRQGTAATMQIAPSYPENDVVTAVFEFLAEARAKALSYGIDASSIIFDPGIGFGKTFAHNFCLIRGIPKLMKLGSPIIIGHSRKAFLSSINEENFKATDRFAPGIAVTSLARQAGAMLFRVHEPRPHREALRTTEAFLQALPQTS